MKITIHVIRTLLGAMFTFSGLAGLLHFFGNKTPPYPPDALAWTKIMTDHNWMTFVLVAQLVGGLLLLVNRFVPLGLTILAPVLVNIILFHALLTEGKGLIPGLIVTLFEVFLLVVYRRNFLPLLAMNPEASTTAP